MSIHQVIAYFSLVVALMLIGAFSIGWSLMPYRKIVVMPEPDNESATAHFIIDRRRWRSLPALLTITFFPIFICVFVADTFIPSSLLSWHTVQSLLIIIIATLLVLPVMYAAKRLGAHCAWFSLTRRACPSERDIRMSNELFIKLPDSAQISTGINQKLSQDNPYHHPIEYIQEIKQQAQHLADLLHGQPKTTLECLTGSPGPSRSLYELQSDLKRWQHYLETWREACVARNQEVPTESQLTESMFRLALSPIAESIRLELMPQLEAIENDAIKSVAILRQMRIQLLVLDQLLGSDLQSLAPCAIAEEKASTLLTDASQLRRDVDDLICGLPHLAATPESPF